MSLIWMAIKRLHVKYVIAEMLLVGMHGIHAASGFWCCPSVYTHLCCGRVPIFVPLIGDVGDNRRANKLRRVASVFGSFICQATMGAGANTVQD